MLENTNLFEGDASKKISADIQDTESAVSWMSNICGPHDLKVHNARKMHFRHVGNVLNSTTTAIGYIEYGTDVTVNIEDLENSYSISLPLSGFQELSTSEQNTQSNITSGVIISPSKPCELNISGNCRKTLVRISRQEMELTLESLIGKPITNPLIFDPKMDANVGASSAWWRTVRLVEEELSKSDSLYNYAPFIRDIEKALIKGILTSQPHNYSDAIRDAFKRKLPAYIIKTIDYIRSNAKNDIHIEDIEWISGVSRNKLYSDFKSHFGEPPTAYLKRVRLEGVRDDIIKYCGHESISTLALNWGFNHLGRFSTEYKKLFGETPSETQAKAKLGL
ncbi:AraC family transcriptional regulator [Marinobacterium sp. D7]|uniref:AraC family transcriptional regulator n=1 Tax=Marinobacterium ramblicola TaxID=2849041 RepID=UPI001C2DC1AE|nr:AraC family transcriptional regulator [Marinobacterium ramblicola]MBV1789115.1 AraC family transcriptional regulator [Marinobacterium ramblicola]